MCAKSETGGHVWGERSESSVNGQSDMKYARPFPLGNWSNNILCTCVWLCERLYLSGAQVVMELVHMHEGLVWFPAVA